MAEKKLRTKMFGGFSTEYGNEALTFGRQRDPKFGQLFQILMTRPGKGFNKKDIAEALYGSEQVEDINASLNNTIFRLRKYLKSSPLPPGEYLILSGGLLRFDCKIQVESDTWSFECAGQEFKKEQDVRERAEICKRACELYQGEFLPQLSSEQWVIEKSKEYEKLFTQMLKYLLQYLKEEGDFIRIESLAARAAEIYPYEGWERWQVESLITRGCHQEAGQAYQAAVERMQKAGGFISKRQRVGIQKTGMKIQYPAGADEDITRCLMEPGPAEGAYRCTLLGFSDCYRMLKRVTFRDGPVYFSLFLCTIQDGGGNPASDREYCKRVGERLCVTFQKCLRRGDVYAQYSDSQYLLLCVGAGRENVSEIEMRIDVDLRKRRGGRGEIRCRLLDDGSKW